LLANSEVNEVAEHRVSREHVNVFFAMGGAVGRQPTPSALADAEPSIAPSVSNSAAAAGGWVVASDKE